MTDNGKPLGEKRKTWPICRAILGAFFCLAIVPLYALLYLFVVNLNPLHSYEVTTCQAVLTDNLSDLTADMPDLTAEQRAELIYIKPQLIEASKVQAIKQAITYETFNSKSCTSKIYLDLFGPENLVACYKSKESGSLHLENPFGVKIVAFLSLILTLGFILGPFRLQLEKLRLLLANKDLAEFREENLNASHTIAIFSIIVIFLVHEFSEEIAYRTGKDWGKSNCKIISNCKSKEESRSPSIVYEHEAKSGLIRSQVLHLGKLRDDEIPQLEALQTGKETTCYVNPTFPQQSYLIPGKPIDFNRIIIFFVIVGLWCWKGWPYLKSWSIKYDEKNRIKKTD